MFLNLNKTWPQYLPANASTTPAEVNNIAMWQSPPRAEDGVMNGASLVVQYLENILYRTTAHLEIDHADLAALWERAILLDEDLEELETVSDECPTLHNCMQAAIDLGFVKGCTVQHIKPSIADIKYFIRQYNGVIVQLKATTTTYNAALLGGLEIVKRYPHAKKSLYVAGGLDATVASYSSGWCVDMQFKNTYKLQVQILILLAK